MSNYYYHDGKRTKNPLPVPTEAEEQKALFNWAAHMMGTWPELELMYHTPNEGKRSPKQGYVMKQEGLKKGVPDICLPVPRGKYHGLYIELKRLNGGRKTHEQKYYINALRQLGYAAEFRNGWQAAAELIVKYLEGSEL